MIKAIYFDLFFTLINPEYLGDNEYDVIGISKNEWERYAEDAFLYEERAKGQVKNSKDIIDKIVARMPYNLTIEQKKLILLRREERIKRALLKVDGMILETLQKLHKDSFKIGLISNADVIDSRYFSKSPLADYFDSVIFSCDVGLLKPDERIYKLAMQELRVLPEESIFVGDGGSNELYGAKVAGMKTIFSEYLESKKKIQKDEILKSTDYHVKKFNEILYYMND